jgi:iron uptake system component EfeO
VPELELVRKPIVLEDLENLPSEPADFTFALTLDPGPLTLYCPGAGTTRTQLAVSGARPHLSARAAAATERYRTWLETRTRSLVNQTLDLSAALRAGDLATARRLYSSAHAEYERVEPVAESFGTLDKAIDARAGDVPASSWRGFHPIERTLWTRRTTAGTSELATRLVADVTAVNAVATRIKLTPAAIANGAVALLDEIARSKITGEEERYSHLDLVDFDANLTGAEAAFDAVAPLLPRTDATLASDIRRRFRATRSGLERYRRDGAFASYTSLRPSDTRRLSRLVDAVAEPLSRVGAAVAGSR